MEKNKGVFFVSAAIIFAFVASMYFDSGIIKAVSSIKNNFLDKLLIGLTFTGVEILVFLFLTIIFLWNENKRRWVFPLWFTLLISTVTSFLLKITIQRPRPFQAGLIEIAPFLIKNSHYIWDFSFPSAQTMLVFSVIPIISKEFPRLKYVWVALACLVGFSRLYFGFHFLSDVIAGAAIGYLLGALVINIEKDSRFWEKFYERIYSKLVR